MPLPLIFAQFMRAYCTAQCPTSIFMEKKYYVKKIMNESSARILFLRQWDKLPIRHHLSNEENIWDMNSFDIHRTIFLSMLFL